MVQANAQPMKTNKIKGPPPVPPRPSQSLVAEALAKTRKAVTESKASLSKSRASSKQDLHNVAKAKTLDRTYAASHQIVSPKQNGLARVKSFIKDVISDRSSSSDERKSSGQNSRRSSSDSNSLPGPASVKRSNESLNSKAAKTCRQILVRSLSTSNKLDQQDPKCKVSKSSSFAEKTLPLRRAPPPPLSPKPKLKPMKPSPTNKTAPHQSKQKKQTADVSLYSQPIDARVNPVQVTEAPYATVDEVQEFDDRLRSSPTRLTDESQAHDNTFNREPNANSDSLEQKTSRVTEMLISEILASRNNNTDEANTVIDKGKGNLTNGNRSPEITKDMSNHEMLIYELQTMRSQPNVPDCLEREGSVKSEQCESDTEPNYATCSLTSEQTDDAYDQAYAYIADDDLKSR